MRKDGDVLTAERTGTAGKRENVPKARFSGEFNLQISISADFTNVKSAKEFSSGDNS